MRIRGLSFDDDGTPGLMTVAMTKDEALFLAALIGPTSPDDREAVMHGGGEIGGDIYDCLVDGVFNRYYDDGVRDALRARATTPTSSEA